MSQNIKRYVIVGALLVLLIGIVILSLLLRRKSRQLAAATIKVVETITAERVAALEDKKRELDRRISTNAEEAVAVKARIGEIKDKIDSCATADDLINRFAKLGY